MYYHTAKSDLFLYDYITKSLYDRYFSGQQTVSANDVLNFILTMPPEKFNNPWSDYVQRRLSRGVMATLRDFGILEGKGKKKISNFYLPIEVFVYIAFLLKANVVSAEKILNHADWKLFLLNEITVERMFLEAHQRHYLEYNAAGKIIRINFQYENTMELVNELFR